MSFWRHRWLLIEAIGIVHVQQCVLCRKTRIRFEKTKSRRPMRRPAAR